MFLLRRGSAPSRPQDRPDVGFGGRGRGRDEAGGAEGFFWELVNFYAIGNGCTAFFYTIFRDRMITFNTVVTALCY